MVSSDSTRSFEDFYSVVSKDVEWKEWAKPFERFFLTWPLKPVTSPCLWGHEKTAVHSPSVDVPSLHRSTSSSTVARSSGSACTQKTLLEQAGWGQTSKAMSGLCPGDQRTPKDDHRCTSPTGEGTSAAGVAATGSVTGSETWATEPPLKVIQWVSDSTHPWWEALVGMEMPELPPVLSVSIDIKQVYQPPALRFQLACIYYPYFPKKIIGCMLWPRPIEPNVTKLHQSSLVQKSQASHLECTSEFSSGWSNLFRSWIGSEFRMK